VHDAELDEVREPGPSSLRTGPLLDILGLSSDAEVAADPSEPLLEALPTEGFDVDAYALRGSGTATGVREGDVIDLGDRAFTVLHLPGHTPGSLNILDADAGVLVSGDVVYEGGLIDGCIGSDVAAYRRTMERLLGIDVDRVLPGHGPVLTRARMNAVASGYLREA
jgi:glyoxylase-like metal-dependent hydrolase (beta-lactamase superfamily II)